MSRRPVVAWFVLVWSLALTSCSGEQNPADALEERLFSPCCWRQSLRDHESEVARSLRGEIERRLAAGEPAATIERDLVARYGDRIRALPPGRDPRWSGAAVAVVALVGGLLLALHIGRRRRSPEPAELSAPIADDDAADRLDDALALVD